MSGHAMCKFCLSIVKDYSKHDITLSGSNIDEFDLDEFDIIHIHQVPKPQFFKTKAKIIYNIHNFALSCPMGGNVCQILNKYLEEPLTCLNCLGYVGIKTGGENMKNNIKLAQVADVVAVHSDFMAEYYHSYNPVVLPLPLQTDILTPCYEKENYLLYLGRLSFEKNPWGFIDVINKTGFKGKMILYTLSEDVASTESQYKELIKTVKNHNKIELILNPNLNYMIDLVKHARFTVLPYFFAEPFGIAAVNSVLCGTPLLTFPYGNLRNMTKLLPRSLDEMVNIIKHSENNYINILKETNIVGDRLREIHNPKNAIKIWDKLYENLIL